MAKTNSINCLAIAKSRKADPVTLLIENEVLLPMRSAVDTFSQLVTLANTIRDTARAPIDDRSDHAAARSALMRIASLAEVTAYMASDFGNFLDCSRGDIEDEHMKTLVAAVVA